MERLPLRDIHTHHYRSDIDSRMSYRPTEPCQGAGLYSVGLHPCYEEDMSEESLALLKKRLAEEREHIWAIGEAGLDKLSPIPLERQIYYMERQIALSEHLGLPMVIHCVRAYNELIRLRRESRATQEWIVHGFRRKATIAEQLLRAGISLSFGEYFDPQALGLAYLQGKAYLESDESKIKIEDIWQQATQAIEQYITNGTQEK